MTTSVEWAERLASGNAVWPWEWTVLYANGHRFHRVCQITGRKRKTKDAPLDGAVAMVIHTKRDGGKPRLISGRGTRPTGIVATATIVQAIGVVGQTPPPGQIACWRFGFMYDEQFVGVTITADGTATWSQ